ncbi:MAG TPA: helix-turn-helix transcriptional regulator [Pyrinomonadaceae bacterium]|jgi:DNA-binding Xre family transcriptional regulator
MLIFNPKTIFALRGIENPTDFLAKNGINRSTASKMLNGYMTTIKTVYVEKICVLLNCTPGDLFEWKAGSKTQISENHALNTLRKYGAGKTFSELVKDIPVEKLGKLEEMLDEMRLK